MNIRKLYYNTIDPYLLDILRSLMDESLFESFRLVGGTALSLMIGHRKSIDIDLFTDVPYGSIDFEKIERYFRSNYKYLDSIRMSNAGLGKSFYAGENESSPIKIDLYYTDPFIEAPLQVDNIRLATVNEIVAMKLDGIQRGGRKKDYWDIHELLPDYSFDEMILLHEKRYPNNHDINLIKANFKNFKNADHDFEPICLRGKYWQLIKLDLVDFIA